jgi:hypothetical protein
MRKDCDGFWVNARDAVDTRVINSYYAGTGSIISSEAEVGGFPVIANGTACTDTDRDGMPDGWELARGLNPTNAADGNGDRDRNGDGYGDGWTNLEEYLNEGHIRR